MYLIIAPFILFVLVINVVVYKYITLNVPIGKININCIIIVVSILLL